MTSVVPGDSTPFPDAVRKLLRERVRGFEELELLLLFARNPDRAWSPADAATACSLGGTAVIPALERLAASQLILPVSSMGAAFRYHPATPALRDACTQLCEIHAGDRFTVVAVMSEVAFERIRNATSLAFADAFVLRKPRKEDPDA